MIEDIRVYDNVVSIETQELIEKTLSGEDFYWFLFPGSSNGSVGDYQGDLVMLQDDPRLKEYLTFGHNFLKDGKLTSYNAEIVYKMFQQFCKDAGIDQTRIGVMKANLQTQCNFSKEYFFNTPHRDREDEHTVAIYYVNDSDGDTTIFDDTGNIIKTVSPKRGRFLVFNGKYFHAGRHPAVSNKRIVINFNF
jgi:hypothetical protein